MMFLGIIANMQKYEVIFENGSSASISSLDTTPSYALRAPIAYDIEGQPVNVTGDLDALAQEESVMIFHRDFVGVNLGEIYVIYSISTEGLNITDNSTLVLNWETHGFGFCSGYTIETRIKVYIWYQNSQWIPIHTISTPIARIDRTNGWQEYTIPSPYSNYLIADELKVKIEFSQELIQPFSWGQWLYINWLVLEVRNNVALNSINATAVNLLSQGFDLQGDIGLMHEEDENPLIFERITAPNGETGFLQFEIEYDLGYYAPETLYGLRFSHQDWVEFEGSGSYSFKGNISVIGASFESFLCYIRRNLNDPITPSIKHAIIPILGDWRINGKIRLRYDIEYTVSSQMTFYAKVDWAKIQIVRGPAPVVVFDVLNSTIYAEQNAWLNITCLDGKAPITEIRLRPWNDLVGTSAGSYLYSQYVAYAGDITLTLTVSDADGDQYDIPLGILQVLHRPISIALYLSEDPLLQEFSIQLYIKDILSNDPLPLYPFTKIILKNGTWFRQQNHQTMPDGTFTIHESVQDYLDWNYTVIIETAETSVYEAASVFSYIVLSQCPPYITITNVSYGTPLKANDLIFVEYSVTCQMELDALVLLRNGTIYLSLPTELGDHNFTFQDVGGYWEYYLYANNSRGFQGFSSSFTLNITPLNTYLALNSKLDTTAHTIILNVQLFDELNRSCIGVPIQITIYDFGKVFYTHDLITGQDGAHLLIHFDQYLDHSFTITITSQATPLYSGAMLSEGGLAYEGYPLYTILGIGVAVGCVSVILCYIKKRLRRL